MFRLTSKGIECLTSNHAVTHTVNSKEEESSSDSVIKIEPKDDITLESSASRCTERPAIVLEKIPKQEIENEASPLPELEAPKTRYNLREKRKRIQEPSISTAQDDDPTEDYEPDPEEREPRKSERYKCEFCPRSFMSGYNFEQHVLSEHVVDKEFQCSQCSKAFITQKKLDSHVNDRHKRLRCKYCSTTYRLEKNLRRHMKEEHEKFSDPSNERAYKCKICGKGFFTKNNYQKHEKIHRKVKPYKCDFCPKSYVKRTDCGQHMANNHGVEKPHKCPVCGKRFYHKRDLIQNHLPYHSEERNVGCDKCHATFKTRLCLKQHIRKFCFVRKEFESEGSK